MKHRTGHRIVAGVLRGGVTAAGVLLAAGLLLGAVSGATNAPALHLSDLFASEQPLHTRLELAGILVGAATPGAGVLTLIGTWIRERDWRAVATASTVIAILIVGMVIGHI